jgi:hypothetical protein
MIGQLQGSRMQISRFLTPRVERGIGKNMGRESSTAMKSETGDRMEKQNGRQEPSIAIWSREILSPFARKFLALKRFILYGGLSR